MDAGGTLTSAVTDAMSAVTTLFTFITGNGALFALAVGFPCVKMGASALKRLIKV